MSSPHWLYQSYATACFLLTQCVPSTPAVAPNLNAKPANQLSTSGNACGPASTLNALRFGAEPYQAAAKAIPGETDRGKLRYIILHYGGTRSSHVPQRYRWSNRGINAADLTDITNELINTKAASQVQLRIPSEIYAFHNAYKQLASSLRNGFPPIVGLRRYVGVRTIDSHFITILQVPDHLDRDANEFPIRYLDPMGARTLNGVVRAQHGKQHTQLVAEVPDTPVGVQRAHGKSQLLMDALIVAP